LFKGILLLLPDSCIAPLPAKNAYQITCPNPFLKPFSQSKKIVNFWPGQIPGEGQVQLCQGYKEEPLLAILWLCVCSAGVSMCSHTFDQKKLPCQDFLCVLCICFQHQRVFNSNITIKIKNPIVIPAMWEVEMGGSWFKANPVQKS
jgi:hypothetical protein